MKPTTLKLLTALLMAAAPAARKFEARRGCRRTAETLRALLRQAARQMQTVSRCVALLIFMAMAADAQTYALKYTPSAINGPDTNFCLVATKLYLTPGTNPPVSGGAYVASVPAATNLISLSDSSISNYLWLTTTYTNLNGWQETPFTNAAMIQFVPPADTTVSTPAGLGIIKQ